MASLKLLVDSNTAIDYLNRREPFFEKARLLMLCGRVGEFNLWMASSQMPGLVYVLSDGGKERLVPGVLARLRTMRMFVNVLSVDSAAVDAMLATTWPDPEDALLLDLALSMRADAIISRDKKFKECAGGSIPVFSCDELFAWLEAEHGVTYDEVPLSPA